MVYRCLFVCCLFAIPISVAAAQAVDEPIPQVDFNRDIRPILSNICFKCHGPDDKEVQGGLRLDSRERALAETDSGLHAIVPGQIEESELVARVTSPDDSLRMPPVESGHTLTPREIQLLTEWVRQGAPYAKHWSYVKPQRPELPDLEAAIRDAKLPPGNDRSLLSVWPRNEIDYFILDRLLREGLVPAPEADRYALMRRVSLDLTGLPPTMDEVERFVNDPDPGAYEHLVDRLLEKPSYGEHWARKWLDLARYADSAGYADDPPRTIWAYRDWVIRSLNDNQPFDQFTIEQLAGDLLPNPTEDQLIATAFHRNTLTNNEGGTNDEEYRNVAIVDRVNTTMATWMGTTINCCQCHNHKYDPITQQEYFRLFAILNNSEDADRRDESPLIEIWTTEQQQQKLAWQAEIKKLELALANPTADVQPQPDRLAELKKLLADAKPATTVPVLRELAAAKRRTTKIQRRGNFLDTGDEVMPGVPAAFQPLPIGEPVDRLALARWLVDADNPLTARVIANRDWEAIFGVGIVVTSEEFGSQGELPTHPELLDWLATELVRLNWDTKAFLKLLVMSAAYRQSSRVTPELVERDPENILLARGPRVRLTAEMIRDQALFVSGLLSPKQFGPPVKPPQPQIGLSAAFGGGIDWQTSAGEDRYRRGIYTTWRRSNPYPSMATFDAPNGEVCTVRRSRTNTPLQALVTLNDPVYVEAAQALARRMDRSGGQPADKVRFGFQLCLARPPADEERAQLVQLYELAHGRYVADVERAKKMATNPLGPVPADADVTQLAAWSVVANVLLNLDEMFMKR